jgi:hypothetical protein
VTTEKVPTGAVTASCVLGVLALLFYAIVLATLSDLASSDAAGNAYAQAFGAIEVIVLWLLLAVIALIAGVKGRMPVPAVFAAVFLIPASGFVTMAALELLSRPEVKPFLWPLVIPAGIPPLVVMFCFWALLPKLRAAIPAQLAAGIVWGAVALLCLAIVPLQQMRDTANEQFAAARAKYAEDFAKLPADAPLWDWVPFLDKPDNSRSGAAEAGIVKLEWRQSDAEIMLDRGDFPLRYLGRFDLTPTPAICDKARGLLRRQAAALVLKSPNGKPYSDIAQQVTDAVVAMKWLVGHDCSCDAESQAWQAMAEAYRDPSFDVVELRELRDPDQLGRQVREYPERFSMLTPKAHLKAWLSFADKKEYRDQALAGARKLDHRTSDAIAMLTDKYDISAPWTVLKYLPALDLETNARLCTAALNVVHGDFAKVYRPKADDPRPYSELLERLGTYQPLTALTWLAGYGCEAEPELSEAEEVVRTYQDSPQRAAMLATLEKLHRR